VTATSPVLLAPDRRAVARARAVSSAGLLAPFLLALAVGGVVLAATGRDAPATYRLLAEQAFGGRVQIANTLVAATPLVFTGLATAVAFRAGVFNIGVEGSLYLGAFAAAWVGFTFTGWPGWVIVPAGLHFLAPGIANSMSPLVAAQARLTPLLARSQLTIAFVAALAAVVLYALLFRATTAGFELRIVGLSPRFAAASGIGVAAVILTAMTASGLLGGLAGAFQVLGVNYRFVDRFSPGYGFTGIAVALLGRNTPLGVLLAALFFGALANGGAMIQLFSDIPLDLVNLLQGTVMIFAVVRPGAVLAAARRAIARRGGPGA
jgi:ABC-type uncharacterized transport system permease subunit